MRNLVALFTGLLLFVASVTTVTAKEYDVKQGDTLWNIANDHDMTVEEIVDLNSSKSTVIQPKQVIKLSNSSVYTIEEGDSLSQIATQHKVRVKELKEWNDLKTDIINVGQELTIKEDKTGNKEVKAQTVSNEQANKQAEGKTFSVTATAYTAECAGCSGITATGINLNNDRHAKVIAVDPKLIPLGSKVYVEGYGEAIAGDTGGAIKGNKIDLHLPTKDEAYQWGVRTVNITVLN